MVAAINDVCFRGKIRSNRTTLKNGANEPQTDLGKRSPDERRDIRDSSRISQVLMRAPFRAGSGLTLQPDRTIDNARISLRIDGAIFA